MKLLIALFGLFFSVNTYAYYYTIVNNSDRKICIRLWHKVKFEEDKLGYEDRVFLDEKWQSSLIRCVPRRKVDVMGTKTYCIDKIDVWDFYKPKITTQDVIVGDENQCQNNVILIDEKERGEGFKVEVNPPEE